MKTPRRPLCLGLLFALLSVAAPLAAQDPGAPAPTPTPAAAPVETPAATPDTPEPPAESAAPVRRPEGSRIIDFPSAQTPPLQTLQLFFAHRFSDPVQGSNIHNLFSFTSNPEFGISLSYTPVKDLEVGLLYDTSLEDYELSAKYAVFSGDSPFHFALRAGGDWRNVVDYPERFTFFAQAVAALYLFDRVNVSVIPSFVTKTASGFDNGGSGLILETRDNVFNVLFAVSGAVTRTINLQAEVVPRHDGSRGTGWIVAIEKTLPKHRFSFTAGNLRPMTVDQYIRPDLGGKAASNVYLGFNIIRQWKL